jgi:hypothetical protein
MLSLIVLAAALALVWRSGYWPFNQSFSYLPSYGEFRQKKANAARQQAPVPSERPTL